jgi:integrase
MSVRVVASKRNPGSFVVDVRVRLANSEPKRVRQTLAVSKSLARKWGEERERDLLVNGVPEAPKEVPTVEQFMARFMDGHVRANRQKPSGIAAKETIFNQHLLPFLGSTRLDAVTTERVQQLKLRLRDRSSKTVNNVVSVLNIMLKKAVEWGVIERMPCAIKLLPVPRPSARFHDVEELERLLAATHEDVQGRLIVLLGAHGGLRCGEMMALEWHDVDLKTGQMHVARSEWKGNVTVPKGGRSRRVPLSAGLIEALRAARRDLRSQRVLVGSDGQPLTQKMVQNIMRRIARKANVRHGVHILRHTFCSTLAARGISARTIQELAGHENLTTTLGYMHVSPKAVDQAIRVLDGVPGWGTSGAQQTGDASK